MQADVQIGHIRSKTCGFRAPCDRITRRPCVAVLSGELPMLFNRRPAISRQVFFIKKVEILILALFIEEGADCCFYIRVMLHLSFPTIG